MRLTLTILGVIVDAACSIAALSLAVQGRDATVAFAAWAALSLVFIRISTVRNGFCALRRNP